MSLGWVLKSFFCRNLIKPRYQILFIIKRNRYKLLLKYSLNNHMLVYMEGSWDSCPQDFANLEWFLHNQPMAFSALSCILNYLRVPNGYNTVISIYLLLTLWTRADCILSAVWKCIHRTHHGIRVQKVNNLVMKECSTFKPWKRTLNWISDL